MLDDLGITEGPPLLEGGMPRLAITRAAVMSLEFLMPGVPPDGDPEPHLLMTERETEVLAVCPLGEMMTDERMIAALFHGIIPNVVSAVRPSRVAMFCSAWMSFGFNVKDGKKLLPSADPLRVEIAYVVAVEAKEYEVIAAVVHRTPVAAPTLGPWHTWTGTKDGSHIGGRAITCLRWAHRRAERAQREGR